MIRKIRKYRRCLIPLALLMLIGAAFRVICCFWGFPYPLHPDEPTVVRNAIDIIRRHSYLVNVYNRPDHFEIKCCAVLFQMVSYLVYGGSAGIMFDTHQMAFYLVARMFTVFWGVLMIPMGFLLSERIRKGSGLITAALIAVYPLFIQHSAYSTPDIVLTFLVMLTAWLSVRYLDTPSRRNLLMMCIPVAVGITVKYTCAICAIPIATVVLIRQWKNPLAILKSGLLCIALILLICFILAPNLFTEAGSVVSAIQREARTEHAGADGLGFFGNMLFYFSNFFTYTGWEAIVFGVAGLIYLPRKAPVLALVTGLAFLLCTSLLALHWDRWGLPFYVFFIILIGTGMHALLSGRVRWVRWPSAVLAALILFNMLGSGSMITIQALLPDARVTAMKYCDDQGITSDNSLYDGYTPMRLQSPHVIEAELDENGEIVWPEGISYLVISSKMYDRYRNERQRYTAENRMYDAIQKEKLVFREGGAVFHQYSTAVKNLLTFWDYKPAECSGGLIEIYARPSDK